MTSTFAVGGGPRAVASVLLVLVGEVVEVVVDVLLLVSVVVGVVVVVPLVLPPPEPADAGVEETLVGSVVVPVALEVCVVVVLLLVVPLEVIVPDVPDVPLSGVPLTVVVVVVVVVVTVGSVTVGVVVTVVSLGSPLMLNSVSFTGGSSGFGACAAVTGSAATYGWYVGSAGAGVVGLVCGGAGVVTAGGITVGPVAAFGSVEFGSAVGIGGAGAGVVVAGAGPLNASGGTAPVVSTTTGGGLAWPATDCDVACNVLFFFGTTTRWYVSLTTGSLMRLTRRAGATERPPATECPAP